MTDNDREIAKMLINDKFGCVEAKDFSGTGLELESKIDKVYTFNLKMLAFYHVINFFYVEGFHSLPFLSFYENSTTVVTSKKSAKQL